MRAGHAWVGAVSMLVALGCAGAPSPRGPGESARPPGTRPPDWGAKVAALEPRAGLLDLYVDRAAGKLLAVLPAARGPRGVVGQYIYVEGIRTGLGSNPVGLDRGQLGETTLLELRRVGARVLFEAPNTRYRALSEDDDELRAVRESFATSVLWGAEILGEDAAGRLLVDLTGFLLRDAHGVAARLAATGQGSFALDRERSAVDFDGCLAFPRNVELESVLTFAGSSPGGEVRAVAPDPQAVTLVLHQSIVALPETGYRPREHDPRMGSFAVEFADYAAPLDRPVRRAWIARHRLEKVDPAAERSPVREPVVYYVDRGAPEPIRSALVEGASWWAQAFAAAGFEDAYRVELLPEGAHPLDVRYNVIQWVHRATRGWSYGGGVIDPRSGEILKGHVSLGSLRIRQDRLLFEGLAGTARTGSGAADDPIVLALARIRQLAAHEVGHTLGLAHNFAASTYGRASVMDYPAPLVEVTADGTLDFSQAYAAGIGEWDVAAIHWAYAQLAPGVDERPALEAMVREALGRGLVFLTDKDARAPSTAHPLASLWDNGADPVAALHQSLRVRRAALARFGEDNLLPGEPNAALEEVFVPLYLHHRFQLVAAAKLVGGVDYRHAVRGDGQPAPRPVGAERQRRALAAILETLAPGFLDIPESALRALVPRAPELAPSRELFVSHTSPVFDALGAAATAADLTLRALLEPERIARLVDQRRRNTSLPGLGEVLDALVERAFAETVTLPPREAEVARVVQRTVVDRLTALAADGDVPPWVRSRVDLALSTLLQRMDQVEPLDAAERAHFDALAAEIGRHLSRPSPPREPARVAEPEPPGEPIGGLAGALESLDECGFDGWR
ncbi:MAG TPA: zinc-dependent metalloprotease [Thermoanaerobaculia bacterium]